MYVWIDRWTHGCMHVHVCNSNAHIPRKSQAQATSMHTIKPSKHTLDYNKSSNEVEKIEIGILFEMCFTCFASSNFYINVFEKRRQRALSEIKLVAGGHASKILFLPGSPGISPKYLPKDTARSSKVWDINVDEW